MKVISNIEEARKTVLRRPGLVQPRLGEDTAVEDAVRKIIHDVQTTGDSALVDYSRRLDGVELDSLEVGRKELSEARVDPSLYQALEEAASRIRDFHLRSKRHSWITVDEGGVGQWVRPLEKVGIYVPGGRAAYPSTLLMTAIPARVAGVTEIVVSTPPSRDGISPAILVAARICGVDRVFTIGGAQAIAAMAFGTDLVPRVDKICGPGNMFVQMAKRQVFGEVDIDGFYGPTETIILTDESADPALCAADILAQAEHDVQASAILVTTSLSLASLVSEEVDRQLSGLNRRKIIAECLEKRCAIVVVPTIDDGVKLVNEYAPEHVSVMTREPWTWAERIRNAGGIFVGENSPEVVGDYVAGPSHVMPTGGTARFSSPVTVESFLKITSVVGIDRRTFKRIGQAAATIAQAEGLTAHAAATELRLSRMSERRK